MEWPARRTERLHLGPLIAFVVGKPRSHGPTEKVLPPREVLAAQAREAVAAEVQDDLTAEVAHLLDLEALAARLSGQAVATMEMAALHASVRDEGLQDHPPEPRGALTAQAAVATADLRAIRGAVVEAVRSAPSAS